MKSKAAVALLLILAAFMSACQGKKNQQQAIHQRCARGGCGNITGDPSSGGVDSQGLKYGTAWGQIWRQNLSQNQFYSAVQGLVSSTIDPYSLGAVSGDVNQNTGVWFWGDVRMAQGFFNPNGNQSAQINGAVAELRIVIWDSFAGQTVNGARVPEYPIHIRGASGTVQGNQASIIFQDGYGQIRLDGTYNANYFSGTISYANSRRYDGSTPGATSSLGSFYVPTCGFFRCSQ